VETIETPKRPAFPRCHPRAVTVRIRVDAQRHFDKLRLKKSQREPDRPCESFFTAITLNQHKPSPQLLDVAEGLNYLHASHTIHGDLKGVSALSGSSRETLLTPAQPNILIKSDGHACLADFGLASIAQGNNSVVAADVHGYSPRWTAPEILEGADKITREADVFSFGMVVIGVSPRIFRVDRRGLREGRFS
jgi:serine/threonine protein kinase